MSLVLLLGGARSGKSEMAETLAGSESARLGAGVAYIAGSPAAAGDDEWAARIQQHRSRRPWHWRTVESYDDLASVLQHRDLAECVVVLDSLGSWLAAQTDFVWDPSLVDALASRLRPTFVVSEEVGMGVHPSSPAGRAFRDALGRLNTEVAAAADRVFLVVAGRRLELDRP